MKRNNTADRRRRTEDTGEAGAAPGGLPAPAARQIHVHRSHPKFSPAEVIQALRQTHGTIYIAARTLGCTPKTIRRYVREHKEVRAALAEARGMQVDLAEIKLHQAVKDGQPWAVTFTLRTLGKKRGYVERLEHAGVDNSTAEIVVNLSKHLDVTANEDE